MDERVGSEAFVRQQAAILGRPDSRPLLRTITVPTLVAVGDADATTPPRRAEEIHRGIVGSELLQAGLTDCIGCGCLSLERCGMLNPGDRAAAGGPGPRYWLGDPRSSD